MKKNFYLVFGVIIIISFKTIIPYVTLEHSNIKGETITSIKLNSYYNKLPIDYDVTKLPNYPNSLPVDPNITKLPNYPNGLPVDPNITKLPNYPNGLPVSPEDSDNSYNARRK